MGKVTAAMPTSESWFLLDDDATRVGAVRRAATAMASALGFAAHQVADLAIITTELATNLVKHAREGTMHVRPVRDADEAGVQLVSIDSGPGMADVARSQVDGESTTGTLGIGLGAVSRLADRCEIYSQPGRGTIVVAELWCGKPPAARPWADGIKRPLAGELVSGDGFAHRMRGNRYQVMVCDGLGHGPMAAAASQAAFGAFHDAPDCPPADVVKHLNGALGHTRGAALAVAEIDPGAEAVRLCGLGNISATVISDGERRGMVSLPGIAGHHRSGVREFGYPFPRDAILVMHSDGVSERWKLDGYRGIESPLLIAATVLRDAGVRRDDACVLVARGLP
jgi:anti-sigma regulatory factor (Ser/Thr protein kinase)